MKLAHLPMGTCCLFLFSNSCLLLFSFFNQYLLIQVLVIEFFSNLIFLFDKTRLFLSPFFFFA